MTLSSTLVKALPREKAGSRTGARYDFQAHAALERMLSMYSKGDDFCAFFDLYDDFVVIDSATLPTTITLFQIKGHKSAAFSCAALVKKKGAAPQTTVGKMYHHTTIFGGDLDRVVLLTNAELKFALAVGGKSDEGYMLIAAKDLDAPELDKIAAALELDFPSPRSPNEKEILALERTHVPLYGYEAYLKGRLLEVLNEATATAIGGLYRTLILEVKSRSNDMTESASLEEMIKCKGLTRDRFGLALEAAEKRTDVLSYLALIEDDLKARGEKVRRAHQDHKQYDHALKRYIKTGLGECRFVHVHTTSYVSAEATP